MTATLSDVEIFTHVRIIIGMVLGLSVARLINGLMRFIQHPGREPVSGAHLIWAAFLMLSIIHFWWFEIAFVHHTPWTFAIYVFLLLYAGLFVALAAILFPDDVREYGSLAEYFDQRRRAFYILLLILLVVDIPDTLVKGHDYYSDHYGWDYPIREFLLIGGTALGLVWSGRRYGFGFGLFALLFQLLWIGSLFEFLD